MPEIVWQPLGPTNHTIPSEWDDLPLNTIVTCECGKLAIHDTDDYGVAIWRHLRTAKILMYRIFSPTRIGRAAHHIPIISQNRETS